MRSQEASDRQVPGGIPHYAILVETSAAFVPMPAEKRLSKKVGEPQRRLSTRKDPQELQFIQSLDRGLLILETVGKSTEPVSLGQLTAVLGIDRSSVFRLANTLKRRGFLANPSIGKEYILGASVWRLSRQYDWSKMLAAVAHDQLKSLAIATNETAHLAIREGTQALFVDHVATSHVVAISGQTGERVPLYCTSHGKALLADFDELDLRALFGSQPLKSYTKQTIVSIGALARACKEIKTRGFALDDCEFMDGVRCVAAPIRDRDGSVIGSIGISVPLVRFPRERSTEYARRVSECARQISDQVVTKSD
jgi:IclR family transcriptional regulator, acetate operon repressor